ncbi:hypothetical protein LSH36_12g10010 [Paralvinella palmiformis]|uniref:Uncharacterized protein n=1 Tax=Paralvinella palmiformis TaxID=53620 RepID=A0AAD9NJ55_9ANNE|nr:hypothetical protein LSH36_12g10010 [Paralvinella palmiformis]
MVFSCFLLPLSCQILSDQHQEIADTAIPGQGHLIQDHTIQGPHDIIIVQGCLLQGHHLHVDITGHVTETDMVGIEIHYATLRDHFFFKRPFPCSNVESRYINARKRPVPYYRPSPPTPSSPSSWSSQSRSRSRSHCRRHKRRKHRHARSLSSSDSYHR